MEINTRITFTPRAKAVLADAAATIRTPFPRFASSSAEGDWVKFADCSSTFVVMGRLWTLAHDAETLEVALDLLEEPGLQAVR